MGWFNLFNVHSEPCWDLGVTRGRNVVSRSSVDKPGTIYLICCFIHLDIKTFVVAVLPAVAISRGALLEADCIRSSVVLIFFLQYIIYLFIYSHYYIVNRSFLSFMIELFLCLLLLMIIKLHTYSITHTRAIILVRWRAQHYHQQFIFKSQLISMLILPGSLGCFAKQHGSCSPFNHLRATESFSRVIRAFVYSSGDVWIYSCIHRVACLRYY